MKIGLLGGSFDPFHLGHRRILEAAASSGIVKRIIVMPLGLAPHKPNLLSMAGYRYQMAALGIYGIPGVSLSNYEMSRGSVPSYTIETIEYLTEELQKRGERNVKIYLIHGSDALFTIESWHRASELLFKLHMMIALRGDEDPARAQKQADYLKEKYKCKIRFFTMQSSGLSGTQIRADIKAHRYQAESFVPTVWDFIQRNKPYEFTSDMESLNHKDRLHLISLEQRIWSLMPIGRLIHSLNVMQYAVHLAVRHGVDPQQAAIAGLLHDCVKYLPAKTQLNYAKKYFGAADLNNSIAHSPAGAYYARRYLGIKDRAILSAICYHTTANGKMSDLDKIIYLADKIEWGRGFSRLEAIRESAELDLNEAMRLCLKEVEIALKRDRKRMHPFTKAAILSLE